ncbi:MAG TPA: polysaccharide biosynthesis/export family protein [Pyrinomonadaceae bacterium]|nr:polysaccharide biosynthesis/export family protein [Pyrinomonadaceae bacterium]
MKKFVIAAAFALVLCAAHARAAGFQVDSVRVGPASEEKAADAGDATATKSKETKPTPSAAANGERRADPPKESSNKGDDKKDKHSSEKSQNPSALPNSTASTATPSDPNKPPATSDAPAKAGADPAVPLGTPAVGNKTNTSGAGVDSNTASQPTATTGANKVAGGATNPNNSSSPAGAGPSSVVPPVELTNVYRVGVGDVLDIRLLNDQDPRQSTLYTVLAGGVLDYPLLKDPLTVSGMTTDELAAQLIADFRHRGLYEHPQVRVGVREYASHAVLISGLAGDPGTKILRREAIPLYVVVAEAQPKPEAGRAVVISHSTGKVTSVDLNDAAGLNMLVQPGDVVSLTVRPPEFFYVGGEIGSPGQKDFHAGMTLTQAVLASGGVTAASNGRVRVARAGADGRLVSSEYDLAAIESGAVPDPTIQAGDRIEVQRGKNHK